MGRRSKQAELDDCDRRLLLLYEENPFQSIRQLSTALKLSPTPTTHRIERLRKLGYFAEHRASIVNPRRVGLAVRALVEFSLRSTARPSTETVVENLRRYDQIRGLWYTVGDVEFIGFVLVRDNDELMKLILELEAIKTPDGLDAIERTRTTVLFREEFNRHKVPLVTLDEFKGLLSEDQPAKESQPVRVKAKRDPPRRKTKRLQS